MTPAQVTPAWLLTHMIGPPSPATDRVLGAAYAAIFVVFATRKFSQRIKDDVGDKSIFEYLAMPPAQREALDQQQAVRSGAGSSYELGDSD